MKRTERVVKSRLWKIVGGIVASAWLSFVMPVMGGSVAASETKAAQAVTETITLKIEGWTCPSCEKDIRRALLAVPGVTRAEVNYARGGAVVEVEQGRAKSEDLMRAVAGAGNLLLSYQALVVPNGTLTAESSPGNDTESWWRRLFK